MQYKKLMIDTLSNMRIKSFIIIMTLFCIGCSKDKAPHKTSFVYRNSELKKGADSLYNADNYGDALALYEILLQDDSSNGEYYYKRGFCYAKLNVFDKSSDDFLKAAKHKFREADAYYTIGVNFMFQGKYSDAVIYLEKSLKLNPSSALAIEALDLCRKNL